MAEASKKILVVEDDDDVRALVEIFLANAGFEVRTARNGSDALRLMTESRELPSVIVLDVEMPVLDGPAMAARLLVENAGREKIPIVLVSGAVDLPAIARRVGTSYVLKKPFDPAVLIAMVSRAQEEQLPPSA